jgi:hypothetical protein
MAQQRDLLIGVDIQKPVVTYDVVFCCIVKCFYWSNIDNIGCTFKKAFKKQSKMHCEKRLAILHSWSH